MVRSTVFQDVGSLLTGNNAYIDAGNDPTAQRYSLFGAEHGEGESEWFDSSGRVYLAVQQWFTSEQSNVRRFADEYWDPDTFGSAQGVGGVMQSLDMLARPWWTAYKLARLFYGVSKTQGVKGAVNTLQELDRAAGEGLKHGAAITSNTFTFGWITPLDKYVNRIVAENGLSYQFAQGAGVLGREALITALTLGTGNILRAGAAGGYGARALLAAKAVQPFLAVREAWQTGESLGNSYNAFKRGDVLAGFGNLTLAGLGVMGTISAGRQTAKILNEANEARRAARSVTVASKEIDILPAEGVRIIKKGERVQDLTQELAQRTYKSGGREHAIISTVSGERQIVMGGSGGIDFREWRGSLRRIIAHTHPTTTGPSASDFKMLEQMGQRSSWIYELFGGGLSKFSR